MEVNKNFVCIVCPTGCDINVKSENGELIILGNKCKRGNSYVRQEMTNPTRVITSTVAIINSEHKRLPVKTNMPIKKPLIFDAMRLLDLVTVTPPIKCGQVIIKDILGTGIDFVATRDI